jgi:hypothetical protein
LNPKLRNRLILFLFLVLLANGGILYWKKANQVQPIPAVTLPTFSTPVRIQLLNGCGEGKIAQRLTDQLRAFGMDVVEVANAQSFDFPETVVLDRMGDAARAGAVATAVGLDNSRVMQQLNSQLLVDVTVIIGKDYNQLKLPKPRKT